MRKGIEKQSRIVLALLASVLVSACAQSPPARDPETVKNELATLERRLIVAVQRKDMDTLNEIWDDEYFGTAPNGATVTKADLMAAVKDGVIEIESIDPEDLNVRLFGDVAVMTGKASVKAKVVNDAFAANVRGTGIFVNRSGKWKIAGVHVGPDDAEKPIGEP
jgi:ketosteroid isomerase-like protein